MRILIDTNILFSALVFPRSKPAQALLHIVDNHNPVLCDQIVSELQNILKRKAPAFLPYAETLFREIVFEIIPAINDTDKVMRDKKDQPILNAAIASNIDIILTGDKDFLSLEIDRPKCMTATQFLDSEKKNR